MTLVTRVGSVGSMSPVTVTGVVALVVVPSPSCPAALLPQQATVLLLRVAHVWSLPAVMVVTLVSPVTVTGVVALVVVPSPSCPEALLPQQATLPSSNRAHVWSPPGATCTTPSTGLQADKANTNPIAKPTVTRTRRMASPPGRTDRQCRPAVPHGSTQRCRAALPGRSLERARPPTGRRPMGFRHTIRDERVVLTPAGARDPTAPRHATPSRDPGAVAALLHGHVALPGGLPPGRHAFRPGVPEVADSRSGLRSTTHADLGPRNFAPSPVRAGRPPLPPGRAPPGGRRRPLRRPPTRPRPGPGPPGRRSARPARRVVPA